MSKRIVLFMVIVFFSFDLWWVIFCVGTLEWNPMKWTGYTYFAYLSLVVATVFTWWEEEKRNWGNKY